MNCVLICLQRVYDDDVNVADDSMEAEKPAEDKVGLSCQCVPLLIFNVLSHHGRLESMHF